MLEDDRLSSVIEGAFASLHRAVLHEDEIVKYIRDLTQEAQGDTLRSFIAVNHDSTSLLILQKVRRAMRQNPSKYRLVRRLGSLYVRGYWRCYPKEAAQPYLRLARVQRDCDAVGEPTNRRKRRYIQTVTQDSVGKNSSSSSLSESDLEQEANIKCLRLTVPDDLNVNTQRRQENSASTSTSSSVSIGRSRLGNHGNHRHSSARLDQNGVVVCDQHDGSVRTYNKQV